MSRDWLRAQNRMIVGGEVLQFARAKPLGDGRWRLSGLLRGRGRHRGWWQPLDILHKLSSSCSTNSLVALDPVEVPVSEMTRIAAIGTGDSDAVIAPVTNAGLSTQTADPCSWPCEVRLRPVRRTFVDSPSTRTLALGQFRRCASGRGTGSLYRRLWSGRHTLYGMVCHRAAPAALTRST